MVNKDSAPSNVVRLEEYLIHKACAEVREIAEATDATGDWYQTLRPEDADYFWALLDELDFPTTPEIE